MDVSSKPVSFEDIIEYSRDQGINLPKSHLETIRISLEQGKATVEQLIENVNAIASRYEEKGHRWYVQAAYDPKYPLMRFMDKSDHTLAYIVERVNKDTHERFYVANRINDNGDHLKISSNDSLEAVRSNVTAYYTGTVIREIAAEKSLEKPVTTPDRSISHKTPELELSK